MARAEGTFEITSGGEDVVREGDGEPKLTRAHGTQHFTGAFEGDGEVEWLSCYVPAGGARLIGLQRLAGALDGRTGTFVIEAASDHDGRQSRGTWTVIRGSGTGELAGITGGGGFHAPGGPAVSYWLDYELG